MFVLSPPDVERFLVCLVGDTVFDLTSKHHVSTLHKVVNHILQRWLKGNRIYQINKYLLIRCNLNTFITLDEVNETSMIQTIVHYPGFLQCEWICLLLEKENLTG